MSLGEPAPAAGLHGVLVVDKPPGMTSHDVVARVRRALTAPRREARTGPRRRRPELRVGHAGTLDPLASGVLVVMVGEATKLAPYLTSADKRYHATIDLGVATDTLDADGRETERAPVPAWALDPLEAHTRVEAALLLERARREQVPPAISAIKLEGRAAYARARAGEELYLAPRPVAVRALDWKGIQTDDRGTRFELDVWVGKGYYVRSLARDLAHALALPMHLAALRRVASGAFGLDEACSLDVAITRGSERLIGVTQAARRCLPCAALTRAGERRALDGKRLDATDFEAPPPVEPAAWIGEDGTLVAIGSVDDGVARVLRGFPPAR